MRVIVTLLVFAVICIHVMLSGCACKHDFEVNATLSYLFVFDPSVPDEWSWDLPHGNATKHDIEIAVQFMRYIEKYDHDALYLYGYFERNNIMYAVFESQLIDDVFYLVAIEDTGACLKYSTIPMA